LGFALSSECESSEEMNSLSSLAFEGDRQHATIVPRVRSIRVLTNSNPIPLEAPFITNTALRSWFRTYDVDCPLEKSISGKIGVPLDAGGSGAWKEEEEDDNDDVRKNLKFGVGEGDDFSGNEKVMRSGFCLATYVRIANAMQLLPSVECNGIIVFLAVKTEKEGLKFLG